MREIEFENPLYNNEKVSKIWKLNDFEKYKELKVCMDDCKACGLKFSQTNKPKILFCSHTICEYCVVRKT